MVRRELADLIKEGRIESVPPDPAQVAMLREQAARHLVSSRAISESDPAGAFSLAGASLAPGDSCTATVTVAVAGAGSFRNVISATAVSNDQAVPALADAAASLQAGAAASVAPVPTLGEVAMAALTLLLAALGVRRLRPTGRRGH